MSVLEFDGMLTVSEPDAFLAKLAAGFGRGKAFEAITPEAMRSATTVTETNPTWKWLDHEPN